jgi:hypothetical protein
MNEEAIARVSPQHHKKKKKVSLITFSQLHALHSIFRVQYGMSAGRAVIISD